MIDRYFKFVKDNGFFDQKRRQQARYWMYETIDEQLRSHFYNDADIAATLLKLDREVESNRRSSFTAAREVLDRYFNDIKK